MNDTLAFYFHIPFCRERCPYCDFYTLGKSRTQNNWVHRLPEALLQETALQKERWNLSEYKQVSSVFFGGGTPSTLPSVKIKSIISGISREFEISPDVEITIEVNPEDVTQEIINAWHDAGINRLSLGVQSFDPTDLQVLGRGHTPDIVERAIETSIKGGFSNINFDFIFGVPSQTTRSLLASLERGLSFSPAHISFYNLTIHRGTHFFDLFNEGNLNLPEEEIQIQMYSEARAMILANGFEHYEISNFALPGNRCRHNLAYWRNQDYLGLGPSAHSFIRGTRFANPSNVNMYLQSIESGTLPLQIDEGRDENALANELLLSGLRLIDGIKLDDFKRRTGMDLMQKEPQINQMVNEGLIELNDNCLCLSVKGLMLSDYVIRELMF